MENTDKEDYLSPMVLQPQNNPVLSEPRLEKPGAGLPLGGRILNRLYYGPWVSKRADWESVDRAFTRTNARILELVKKIPHDRLETKILVPPMQGLEDSSRFWSM